MPELPEVETIRGQLAPLVQGKVLRRIEILDARGRLRRRFSLRIQVDGAGAASEGFHLARGPVKRRMPMFWA